MTSCRTKPARWPALGLLCLATLVVPAHGAGLGLREFRAPLNATASAGWAALGEDASTAATNPAAMTRLKQSEFLAGPQLLVVDIRFDTEQSSFGGGNAGCISLTSLRAGGSERIQMRRRFIDISLTCTSAVR